MTLRSPAFPRNRGPILDVLRSELGAAHHTLLELGSGPGEHACWLAPRCPQLETWLPSDPSPAARASVSHWRCELDLESLVAEPLDLGLGSGERWPELSADIVLVINVLHMVPLDVAIDLMARAGNVLDVGGKIVIYDCFTYEGEHVSPSNAAFADRLRRMGGDVHPIEPFVDAGLRHGFVEPVIHWLPANNQGVVFHREGEGR